ncbi:MAG TPA: chaperone ClpB, partial [Ruminococcaceae bacterium]|nr:chaperone ClpB [Oscillospiraceae bacterium]
NPYSIILMDEIEKAHPDVLNILLQILDDGHVTDAHGRKVNFENTVIIMTSNAGSDKHTNSLGFNREPATVAKEHALKALSDFLRPEFLSRIDEIIVFQPLSEESLKKIAALMLNELKESLAQKNMDLLWDDSLINALVQKSIGGKFGARDLRHTVRKEIEDKVAELMVTYCERPIKSFNFSAHDQDITATVI